jgi:hypothetical protein
MDGITQSTAVVEVFHFGYGETKQGTALIALSNRGVVAILLGEDRLKLRRELGDAFPGIHLIETGSDFTEKFAKVIDFIAQGWNWRCGERCEPFLPVRPALMVQSPKSSLYRLQPKR